jgi:IS5 family transposase
MFRAALEAALAYADGVKGGRPPYDAVMMFKFRAAGHITMA